MYRNRPGELLWEAPPERADSCRLAEFMHWLEERHGRRFGTYQELWAWSVEELEPFWASVWDYFDVHASAPYRQVLTGRQMPGARWFGGARLNWAEHALRHKGGSDPALIAITEDGRINELSWDELRLQVAGLATSLRQLGVGPGDRVAAVLPNITQTVVGLLATASIGAVWACVAPDLGVNAIAERLSQLRPSVLIMTDGYQFGGERVDCRGLVPTLRKAIPGSPPVILAPYLFPEERPLAGLGDLQMWDDAVAGGNELCFEQVDFDHPLWVLFTSGRTGIPKGVLHGHGGILVEAFKTHALMFDVRPGDRMLFTANTGRMVWNLLITTLQLGACPVLFDGSPTYPDVRTLWRIAEEQRVRCMGFGSSYVDVCQQAGFQPGQEFDLSALDLVITLGSPLPVDGWHWVYDSVSRNVRLSSSSGGTEVCTAFVGGAELLPVYAMEHGPAWPGVEAHAWNDSGGPVTGEMAELVITAPMPSMPVLFLDDPGGARRDTYFDVWPGVWRHGDRCTSTERGTFVIHGPSDAVIHRGGIRVAASEIYEIVESLPEVIESLVVSIDRPDGGSYMPLFVTLTEGATLDSRLRQKITDLIHNEVFPGAVPDEIVQAPGIPHTMSGERLEVPIKALLQGALIDSVVNLGMVDSPGSMLWYAKFAQKILRGSATVTVA